VSSVLVLLLSRRLGLIIGGFSKGTREQPFVWTLPEQKEASRTTAWLEDGAPVIVQRSSAVYHWSMVDGGKKDQRRDVSPQEVTVKDERKYMMASKLTGALGELGKRDRTKRGSKALSWLCSHRRALVLFLGGIIPTPV